MNETPDKTKPVLKECREAWEYHEKSFAMLDTHYSEYFKEKGLEGWELCAVYDKMYYFKRKLSRHQPVNGDAVRDSALSLIMNARPAHLPGHNTSLVDNNKIKSLADALAALGIQEGE